MKVGSSGLGRTTSNQAGGWQLDLGGAFKRVTYRTGWQQQPWWDHFQPGWRLSTESRTHICNQNTVFPAGLKAKLTAPSACAVARFGSLVGGESSQSLGARVLAAVLFLVDKTPVINSGYTSYGSDN